MQYQNPNYFMNYQQPQYNPYLQRMENLQQFQQAIQQPTISTQQVPVANQFAPLGKMVESIDIVKVTDIPMDGNMYYFPKADGTEIYAKQFGVDGKTRILTFKPILDGGSNNSTPNEEKLKFDTFACVLEGIQNDVRSLSDKIDKISKPTRSKREVAEDE